MTRAGQSPECPAPSGVLGDSSDLAGCAPLERLLPCPFRRPWMAGGRRPLAATSLHHKHRGRLDRRGRPETPCSGPTNRRVPTQRGGRAARQLCWSSIPGTGDEASLWCDGRCSQGRESLPNDEECASRTLKEESCRRPTHIGGAVREMEACWPSGVGLRGQASNHPVLRWLKTVVVSDPGKRRGLIASGGDQEDVPEASRPGDGRACAVEASKILQTASKSGVLQALRDEPGGYPIIGQVVSGVEAA